MARFSFRRRVEAAPAQDAPPKKDLSGWHQGISGTLGVLFGLGAIWWPAHVVQFTASAALFSGYCAGHLKGSQNPDAK